MKDIDPIVLVLMHIRKSKGISQESLASLTGVSLRTIQRIESGATDMKLSQYRAVMEGLDLTDMDVSVAVMQNKYSDASDVAAVAKKLPPRVREALVRFLVDLSSNL